MKLYLFDRTEKIIHFDDLTILNSKPEITQTVELSMSENEVFVFQLALLCEKDDVIQTVSSLSDLDIICINTDIVNKFGVHKRHMVSVKKNIIQPLFFTVTAQSLGERKECAQISIATKSETKKISLVFNINTKPVKNNGYDDLNTLSRIQWLNSTLCIDDNVIPPFVSPKFLNGKYSVLGRNIELFNNAFPAQVYSMFNEEIEIEDSVQKKLFYKPCEFIINGKNLPAVISDKSVFNNRIEIISKSETDDYYCEIFTVIRYEGLVEYSVLITPKRDFSVSDVSLGFYVSKECSALMHGLGIRACKAHNINFKWDNQKQQDSLFIGCVNCSMRLKLKAEVYQRPLVNIFYKNLPLNTPETTWDNYGKGGISVRCNDEYTHIRAYTGNFEFHNNEPRHFDFEMHTAPIKPIDYKKAFSVRYYHANKFKNEIKQIDEADKKGLNYVIFHQGSNLMPYINYPFYETDRLKRAVLYAKDKNIAVKLYYTLREHSNHMSETFVYKALGDEIILRKRGVSHSWQKEVPQWLVDNFGEDIIPGWFVKYKHGKYKNQDDISFIVKPDTRLDNYYIEGLNWLVDNIGIKGIYIDDTALDRTTLERAKKVLAKNDGLIDMHMWNHEEPRAGDVSCMNLYTELLPFLDSVWLGEGFYYKKYSPEYMLAEVSGIPYGLTSQMLEMGGDFYLGMIYAMNNRFAWNYKNATKMYKVWDDFDISDSKMLGYWHSKNPVSTNNDSVLSTVYLKKHEALVCLYNFDDCKATAKLQIDEGLLGFCPERALEIKFGKSLTPKVNINKPLNLKARKGVMILLSDSK